MNGSTIPEVPPETPKTPQSAIFELALFAVQELLRHSPEMFAQLAETFSKPNVTLEDIAALRIEIAGTRYKDLVPGTAIPPSEQT